MEKQNGEKKKKNGKKTTTQDAQSHTQKTHAKSNTKIWEVAGRALDCEPEDRTPPNPPSIPTSLASYVQYLAWDLGRREACFCPPSFLGSQSRGWSERHAGIKFSDRYVATEVKGKLREGSKA